MSSPLPSLETSPAGVYVPSPWGNKFHTIDDNGKPITEILAAGSAGPGKSTVLFRDPLFQAQREDARCRLPKDHPHWIPWGSSAGYALLVRRTTPMVEELWRQTFHVFPKWDPSAKPEARTMTWIFASGYRYQLGHCNEVDDWERYMGNGKTYIGYDELITFEKSQYENINLWLRSADPVLANDLKIRATSNPVFKQPKNERFTVSNPHWVREYFVEPCPAGNKIIREVVDYKGERHERTRMYLPATLEDNPDPIFRERYKARLVFALPHIRKALIEGDWYATPGGYFEGVWDPDIHVIQPFSIPREWPVWRCMDWGYKSPGVVIWMARDPDGNFIAFKEFNFMGMVDEDVADNIIRIEKELGLWYRGQSLISGPADTQIWEQRGNAGVTTAQVFLRKGIPWTQATKERIANGQAVAKRLADHDNRATSPGLMFFDTCVRTCQHFPNVAADQKMPEMPMKGGNDHWFDAVCYGVRYGDKGVFMDRDVLKKMIDEDMREDAGDYGVDGYGGF